jgi:hypothetical protein
LEANFFERHERGVDGETPEEKLAQEESSVSPRKRKRKADDMALYEEQTKRLTPIVKKTNGYIRRRKTKSRWN